MTRTRILVAALSGLALVGCGVESNPPTTLGAGTYVVRGTVTNLTGTLLQNVTVQIQPLGGGPAIRTMTTDATGTYRTHGMQAGLYRVAVVMGDSSRLTASSRRDTIFVGENSGDSTIVPTLTYDPGRAISGTISWSVQDTLRTTSQGLGGAWVWLSRQSTPTTYIDSIRTSATGSYRFAVRTGSTTCPGGAGCYRVTIDTTGFRAVVPSVVLDAAIVDFANLSVGSSSNATSTVSGSVTYRPPYQLRVRIFKDRNGDGVYRASASDPDTIVSGVRFWLRRVGSTANLGSSTVTSSTSTSATGNISFTGLDAGHDRWAIHPILWYLPAGCTISAPDSVVTAEGDIRVTSDVSGGTVPLRNIPLTCP
jgi:hypothetical protein